MKKIIKFKCTDPDITLAELYEIMISIRESIKDRTKTENENELVSVSSCFFHDERFELILPKEAELAKRKKEARKKNKKINNIKDIPEQWTINICIVTKIDNNSLDKKLLGLHQCFTGKPIESVGIKPYKSRGVKID